MAAGSLPGAPPTTLVTDVQRFSLHDGAGIRTTVFFKGCPLACAWCHNPEAIDFANEPLYAPAACVACGACVAACPAGILELRGRRVAGAAAGCTRCLACAGACPGEGCRPAAREVTPQALLQEVLRDRDFYGEAGGLTLSGGEPLARPAFLGALLPLARAEGLQVVVQTCGHFQPGRVLPLLQLVDEVQLDLKLADPARHRALTGQGNARILANLRRLVAAGRPAVQPRVPLIPGANMDRENLERTAAILAALGLRRVVVLPFHRLGEPKRASLRGAARTRLMAPGAGAGALLPPTPEQVRQAAAILRRAGLRVVDAEGEEP